MLTFALEEDVVIIDEYWTEDQQTNEYKAYMPKGVEKLAAKKRVRKRTIYNAEEAPPN